MAEPQISNLMTRVRFPSPALDQRPGQSPFRIDAGRLRVPSPGHATSERACHSGGDTSESGQLEPATWCHSALALASRPSTARMPNASRPPGISRKFRNTSSRRTACTLIWWTWMPRLSTALSLSERRYWPNVRSANTAGPSCQTRRERVLRRYEELHWIGTDDRPPSDAAVARPAAGVRGQVSGVRCQVSSPRSGVERAIRTTSDTGFLRFRPGG